MRKPTPTPARDAESVEVPARPTPASASGLVESFRGLAQRRDALRLMASLATGEADRLDDELAQAIAAARREIDAAHYGLLDTPPHIGDGSTRT